MLQRYKKSAKKSHIQRKNRYFTSEFPSFRTTVFPRFQNSRRSERQHFRNFRIPVVPNDSISAISEFSSFRIIEQNFLSISNYLGK